MVNLSSVGRVALPLGLMTLSLHLHAREDEHPNVIFILADDYGWNDLSCMGSQYYETPNLDRLAKHGVKFTNAYAACQVSSPSRASIMTGKYTPRHGVTDWIGEKSGEDWRSMKRHMFALEARMISSRLKWKILPKIRVISMLHATMIRAYTSSRGACVRMLMMEAGAPITAKKM